MKLFQTAFTLMLAASSLNAYAISEKLTEIPDEHVSDVVLGYVQLRNHDDINMLQVTQVDGVWSVAAFSQATKSFEDGITIVNIQGANLVKKATELINGRHSRFTLVRSEGDNWLVNIQKKSENSQQSVREVISIRKGHVLWP